MNKISGNMEVINLEQKLTIPQQVTAFNENVLGYYGGEFYEDFTYVFAIGDIQLKEVEKEKGEWWGTMDAHVRYGMNLCIDMGYLPKKLFYIGFDKTKDVEQGGRHTFLISCEDKRIIDRKTGEHF